MKHNGIEHIRQIDYEYSRSAGPALTPEEQLAIREANERNGVQHLVEERNSIQEFNHITHCGPNVRKETRGKKKNLEAGLPGSLQPLVLSLHKSLLKHGPITSSALAEIVKIPTSTVRPRLSQLSSLGLAVLVGKDKKQFIYSAVPASR